MFDFSHFSRLNPIRYVMQTLFFCFHVHTLHWLLNENGIIQPNQLQVVCFVFSHIILLYEIASISPFDFSLTPTSTTHEHFFFIFINYNPLVAVHGGFMERIRYCFIFFYLFFCTSVYIESITASSVFRYFAMETGLILDGVPGCFPLFESGKRRARKKIKFQCGQKAIQKQNIKIENVVRPTMEIAHSSLSLSRPLPLSVSSSLRPLSLTC